MAIINVTDSDFQANVLDSSEKPVLVDFWAAWCGPCRMVAPILEKLDANVSDKLQIAKMDIDANPATPQQFEVSSIPTLVLYQNGKELTRIVGVRSEADILKEIETAIPGF